MEQLSPRAATSAGGPTCLDPVLCSKGSHCNEKPTHHNKEQPLLTTMRESLHMAKTTQHSQRQKKHTSKKKKKKKDEWIKKLRLYTHKGILFSHKKNDILDKKDKKKSNAILISDTTGTDLEGITLRERNQRKTSTICSLFYAESKQIMTQKTPSSKVGAGGYVEKWVGEKKNHLKILK